MDLFKNMDDDLKNLEIKDADLKVLEALKEEFDSVRGVSFIEYLNGIGLVKDAIEKIKMYKKAKDSVTKEYSATVLLEYYQAYKDSIPGAQSLDDAFKELLKRKKDFFGGI